jgi:hypothetical protein
MKLKGDSGFVEFGSGDGIKVVHVAAPYDNNGKVFVWDQARRWWRRMDAEHAMATGADIIMCVNHDDRPATQLDHYWPDHGERTLCAECAEKEQKSADREMRRWINRVARERAKQEASDDQH